MTNADVTTHILAIMAEATDYTKISLDKRLACVMTLPNVINLEENVMSKDFESIQQDGNVQLNAVTTKLPSFGTIVESIFSEATDYTKMSVDARMAFVEKLLGAKSLDTVIQIQSEYAKT